MKWLFFPATCASEKTLLSLQACELGTQTKPSEAGLFGRGGARERSDAWPLGRDERCGLCPDDVRCSRLHLFEKMLAFLREAVDFVDSLSPPERRAGSSLTAAGCRLLPENEVVHILRPPLPAALRLPLFHGPRPLSPNGRSGPVYAPPGPPVPSLFKESSDFKGN